MSPTPHRLPDWAARALRRGLPGGVRGASIRGDLAEEYSMRRPGLGREVWLAAEVARLVYHYRRSPGWGGGAVSTAFRFALRRLRRDPVFGGLAILTTALGIGGTVALFSVVKAVLLDPLPYHDPEGLVAVYEAHLPRAVDRNVANPGNVAAWREAASIVAAEGIVLPQPRLVSAGDDPREVMSSVVTPGYLEVLGVEPESGPGFSPAAGAADGGQVVLSRLGWLELLGGDPDAIGRTLTVNGTSAEVVGVLPAVHLPFADGSLLLLAMPLSAMGDQTNSGRFLNVVARRAAGAELADVRRELQSITAGLRATHPDFNAGWYVQVEELRGEVLGDVRAPLWILFGAVGVLLLVACVNVANLTLARATDRSGELAVRTALGASRGGLAGQLVVESLVLAALGGFAGIGVAWLGTRLLTPALMESFTIPRLGDVGLDIGVLAFAAAVTAGTGLFFGLAPAVSAGRRGPAATLGAEGRRVGRGGGRVRRLLVVAEVALSVVLLTTAGLLVRSFDSITNAETGFDAARVVTGRVNLAGPRYAGTEPDIRFFDALEPRLASLPGADAAGGVSFLPLDGLGSATSFHAADRAVPPREEWLVADIRTVTGDYFGAMGIALVQGRAFEATDRQDSERVVVVSRSLVERTWPGENPIGRPLAINWDDLEPWTVVGVVEDVVHADLTDAPRPMAYHTVAQAPYFPFMTLVVRTRADAAEAVAGLRRAVAGVDPAVPLTRVQTMDAVVRASTARPRITAFLVTLFAAVAALLAAVGLYGVLSFAVARRVREIGVRMALGARAADVVTMVTLQGLRLVAAGLVIGLAIAAAGSRLLESILFSVSGRDPLAFGASAALFALVGAAACVIPALRAVRVRPGMALREE
ncbi:MAG: ABC transporter permease [Gemmatimonadetes bacterium]|nr:ABC transporter permease [Gemmatimonadota bacterium]NNF39455.1 ABC transporter permease [Gemmatimonadota bacterium]